MVEYKIFPFWYIESKSLYEDHTVAATDNRCIKELKGWETPLI